MLEKLVSGLGGALFGTGGFLRVRAAMALGLTGTVIYLFLESETVPPELMAAWGSAAGFYYGTRSNGANS